MKQPTCCFVLTSVLAATAVAQVDTLPPPVVHGNSFETISNSRYSSHSGFTSALSDTVLSNVLWAMSRAPSFGGAYRDFYVATPSNVYLYDPIDHTLTVHLSGNHRYSSSSAFEIGVSVERNEEAGMAIVAGLMAGDAFWSRGSGTLTSCPMAFAANYANSNWNPTHYINMVDVFGRMTVTGLTDSCVAISSDSTLPRPVTNGADTFEVLVANLGQDTLFDPAMLPLSSISQILWAGYGVTPHMPIGKRGLTIPSAVAYYYLTQHIFVVTDTAVMRYHNRLPPGTNLSTADHRLQLVTSGDRRDTLRTACTRLPQTAPVYIVICYTNPDSAWAVLETGFAAWQYLMQAEALGLAGCLTAPLSAGERTAIISALGLPSTDYPVIVFSTGGLATGVQEQPTASRLALKVRPSPGLPVSFDYSLPRAGAVEFAVRDLAGRTVCNWTEARTSPGSYSSHWQGTDNRSRPVASGVYLCQVKAGSEAASARIVLTR
jgi:hypothetical protein